MKTTLVLVGKTEEKYLIEACGIYVDKLSHYIDFDMVVIPALKNTKALSPAMVKEKEGELILKQIQPADYVVLLDEKGAMLTSVEFSTFFQQRQLSSIKQLKFVIGGAYGFSADVYVRKNQLLSLSKMTFSHQMVRLIFLEQLYRAQTILRNEPYHHI